VGIILPELKDALVCELGLISFPEAMEYEHKLLELRHQEKIQDTLLIFQHPPTVTMGRFGKTGNVLLPRGEPARRGIEYYDSDRGGDATFNCPGQLIVHPIFSVNLRGARAHINDLEEMCLRVLEGYGISGRRSAEHPGIWIAGKPQNTARDSSFAKAKDKQIGAVGLRFSRGVSMHGLSLNVGPDLSSFGVINLCGVQGARATSIENELGRSVAVSEVIERIKAAFSDVFRVRLVKISKDKLKGICFGPPVSRANK